MSGRRLRAVGLTLVGLVAVAYLLPLVGYQWVRARTLRALDAGSQVAATARGPIEYALVGSGPTVLVSPGSFGGYDQALSIGRSLEPLGFRVLAVSRPGYLRTPLDAGRTPKEQGDAFAALLDALDIDRVAVVSASGGGPAALEFAAGHPERLWGLVLVSSLSGPKAQPPARTPGPAIANTLLGTGFTTWWQLRGIERSGAKALDSPIFTEETRVRLRQSPEQLSRFFELAWFRYPPDRREAGYLNDRAQFGEFAFDGFERITAPTLVVHGVGDVNVPIEHGDRAAARIPGAEALRVDGADHYLAIAFPEVVWPRVGEFLHRVAPR